MRYHDEWTLDPKYYEYFFGIKVLTLDNIIINHFIKSILDPTLFKRMCKRLTDMYVLYTEEKLNINPELKKLLTKERLLEYQELIDWTKPNNGEIKKTTYEAIIHEIMNKLKKYYFFKKNIIDKEKIHKFLDYLTTNNNLEKKNNKNKKIKEKRKKKSKLIRNKRIIKKKK